MRNLLPPPLFLLTVTLCSVFAVFVGQDEQPPDVLAEPVGEMNPVRSSRQVGQVVILPPGQDRSLRLLALKERPLFSETRRLPVVEPEISAWADEKVPEMEEEPLWNEEAEQAVVEAPSVLPPELHFLGLLSEDQEQMALVRLGGDESETWVRAGEEINGWTVAKVTSSQLILHLLDEEHIVELIR